MIEALFFLSGVIPFVANWPYEPFATWVIQSSTLLFFLFVSSIVFIKTRQERNLYLNPLAIMSLLLGLLVLTNTIVINSYYLRTPILVILYLAVGVLLINAIKRTALTQVDVFTPFLKGLFFCSWIQVIFSFLQLFGGIKVYSDWMGLDNLWIPRYPGNQNANGMFFQSNHYATFLFMAMAAGIYLLVQKRIPKSVFYFWVALSGISLGASASRSVVLYALIIFCLGIIAYRKKLKGIYLSFMAASTLLIATQFLSEYLRLFPQRPTPIHRLGSEDVFGIRFRLWKIGLSIFKDHPWFGVGWGNFGSYAVDKQVALGLDPRYATVEFHTHSHNFFIQLLAETGLVGTVPIVIGLGYLIWTLIKGPWTEIRLTVIAISTILFFHSQLEYPFWYAYFLLPLYLVISTQDTAWIKIKLPRKILNLTMCLLICTICSGIALSLWSFGKLVNITYFAKDLTTEQIEDLKAASKLKVFDDIVDYYTLWFLYDPKDSDIQTKLTLVSRLETTRPTALVLMRKAIYLSYLGKAAEALSYIDKAYINNGTAKEMWTYLKPVENDLRLSAIRNKMSSYEK